ncbi:MAG: tetratricopeptide repeat protein [Thermoanaerobaculia bacterium]|nr:tetratricopeptide repeat protein [Thermoanaerobaculia bacterium]
MELISGHVRRFLRVYGTVVLGPLLLAPSSVFSQSVTLAELTELEDAATQSYIEDDLETAAALYRQLARLHSDVGEKTRILMTVASIEHDQGSIARAVATLAEVLTLDPDYQLRPELYGETFVPLFYEAKEEAEARRKSMATQQVSEGLTRLNAGDESGARRLLEEAIQLRGDHPEAIYNLALLNLRQGRDDEAMAGFQKVIALADAQAGRVEDDTLSRALTNAGLLFLRTGSETDAADALQRAVDLDGSNAAAWSNLGTVLRSLGRRSEAARAFTRAYEREPDEPSHLSNLAVSYLDAGDVEGAARLLSEGTGRFPRHAELWLHLGTAYRKLQRNQQAVDALEAALHNDPSNQSRVAERAALELAVVQYRLRDLRATLRAADRALELRSDSVDALIYRALALEALGDLEPAQEALETARTLAPTRGMIFLNLGNVLFRLGDWDGAETAFERALELDPDEPTARQNLDQLRDARRRGAVPQRQSGRSASRQTQGRQSPPPSQGRAAVSSIRHVDLGIEFSDVDYSSLGLQGAMIERVRAGSVAGRAGLRDGDLMLRLDGEAVSGEDDFSRRLGRKPAGSRVEVTLLRDNRPLTLTLVVP